jgi:hypothetical protein
VHAAAALAPAGEVLPCGLATLGIFAGETQAPALAARDGAIPVPAGGLSG